MNPSTEEGEYNQYELDETVRERLLDSHPIVEKNYCITTPMLVRTYATVRERVWARRTGIYFFGPTRTGKTTCAEEIEKLLNSEFPKCYVLRASMEKSSTYSASHIISLLLEASDHELHKRKDQRMLFMNLKDDIVMELSRRGGSQFILILDEAQFLNDMDFTRLLELHNAMALRKIRMTTISFAQPEINHKVAALLTKKQRQIIARFLAEPLSFEGCSSRDELRTLLIEYDENSDYPEGSGWSYTRFFFPLAFKNGLRLHNFASEIWRELTNAAGENSIPMEHLCLTIENLLLIARHDDCANFQFTERDIKEAVEISNLSNFNAILHQHSE